ncbi:MAG TPA: hypothetical protein VFT82_02235 [Candidatus Paceibacterota bacterium]|nr:hypothetical protein [Candidatus Paceibacterota bacterium]
MRKARIVLFGILSLAIIGSAHGVSAQNRNSTAPSFCPGYGETVVDVSVSAPATRVAAGASLPITVKLANVTDRTLSGGAVLIRLVANKLDNEVLAKAQGGIFVRMIALDGLSLAPRASKETSVTLDLSSNLPQGTYSLEAVYTGSNAYDLENPDANAAEASGANFGSATLYVVNPASTGIIYIDPKAVMVNDTGSGSSTAVTVSLVNTTNAAVAVPLLWKAYFWQGVSEKMLVQSSVGVVRVPANGKAQATFNLSDAKHSRYEVVATAQSEKIASIMPVEVDKEVNESMLRYLGAFMAPNNGGTVAYACIHNVYSDDTEGRTVNLNILSESGSTLGTGAFPISSGVLDGAVSKSFVAAVGAATNLRAAIVSVKGDTLSSLEGSATCADLNTCSSAASSSGAPAPVPNSDIILAVTLIAAGVGGLLALAIRKKALK